MKTIRNGGFLLTSPRFGMGSPGHLGEGKPLTDWLMPVMDGYTKEAFSTPGL